MQTQMIIQITNNYIELTPTEQYAIVGLTLGLSKTTAEHRFTAVTSKGIQKVVSARKKSNFFVTNQLCFFHSRQVITTIDQQIYLELERDLGINVPLMYQPPASNDLNGFGVSRSAWFVLEQKFQAYGIIFCVKTIISLKYFRH